MFQEIPGVHALAVRDALVALPPKLRNVADTYLSKVPAPKKNRKTKPVIDQVHSIIEDALLLPIHEARDSAEHYFRIPKHEGTLPQRLETACAEAKANVSGFMHGKGGLDPALASLGDFAHWIVDSWNPFHLSSEPDAEGHSAKFLHDVITHPDDLPFMLKRRDGCAYSSWKSAGMEMEGRFMRYTGALYECYLSGNGWPIARPIVSDWWNHMVNDIANSWLWACE